MTRQDATPTAANRRRSAEVNGQAAPQPPQPGLGRGRPRQSRPLATFRGTRPTVVFVLVGVVALIPSTVGLAVTLPAHDVVGSWTLTWTGFDIALFDEIPGAIALATIASKLLRANAPLLIIAGTHDRIVARRTTTASSSTTVRHGEQPVLPTGVFGRTSRLLTLPARRWSVAVG